MSAPIADDEAALRWKSVVESAVDGLIVIDAQGRIEAFNPAAERLFGYRESEVLGRNISLLMPPPDHERHDQYLARHVETGAARIIGIGRDVTGLRKDGTRLPLHLSVGEITVAGERKFTGILHDLTSRVALEERLRASEARWRSIVESAVDGIVVMDASGLIEAFNPAAERLFGYEEADVLGRNVTMLMPSPDRERHDSYLRAYLRTGVPNVIGRGREVRGRRRDGTTFPLHLSVGEMTLAGERKFTGILHDLSERVRLEEQLRERTALARLGEMAAVVAHEVKNPLAGIRGVIQVFGRRFAPGTPDAEMAQQIIGRIDALDDLMKDLLLFARPPEPRRLPVDVGAIVMSTAHLLSGDPALREITVQLRGSSPPIAADPELLGIVFHNVMVNGGHAMSGRGTIRIDLAAIGAACRIAFADSGPGIPHAIRDKIFTPFFTTKPRGTGLGLATARRLVEAHRGTIGIDCPPQGGTIVTVDLPAG